MDYGAVLSKAGNRLKTVGEEILATAAEVVQFFNNIQFGFVLPVVIKPV